MYQIEEHSQTLENFIKEVNPWNTLVTGNN